MLWGWDTATQLQRGRKLAGHSVYRCGLLPFRTPPELKDRGHARVSGGRAYQVLARLRFGFPGRALLALPTPPQTPSFPPQDSTRAAGSSHRGAAPRCFLPSQQQVTQMPGPFPGPPRRVREGRAPSLRSGLGWEVDTS